MGKKRRDGRAASRRGNNAAARNSGGGGLQRTATGIRYGNDTYEGELKDGKPHGEGRLVFANGDVYEGPWKEGELHGRGVCRYLDGALYEGEYKGGERHGWGTYRWEDGRVYEGELENNKRQGRGTMTWPSGQSYEGQWLDDKPHGKGTTTYSSRNVYEGEFKEGEEHGKGTMKFPSGENCKGIWVHGELTNVCTIDRFPSDNSATGESSHPNADRGNGGTTPKANHEPFEGRKLRSQRSQQRRLQAATKKCEHCGVDDYQYKLQVCSGCNLALYCSPACQKAASRSHRRICDIVSMLPWRDSDRIDLAFDRETMVDLDAGLRYGTKYMAELKHLQINLRGMASGDALKLSTKQLSSFLRSKKGVLESVFWETNAYSRDLLNGNDVWKELHGLKQLYLDHARFDDVQPLRDIVLQQLDTLEVMRLPELVIDWHKAKTRQAMAQTVSVCKHLVNLDLQRCVLMDSDLKVMLHDLPNLRILRLSRRIDGSHDFTDNTCGLIARKCPGLQELNLYDHNQLSARGIRKIFVGCPHLRSFVTTTRKLCREDVGSLLGNAPQLMYFSFGGSAVACGELDEIIEATGGRTLIQFNKSGNSLLYEPDGETTSSKAKEMYYRRRAILVSQLGSRQADPELANDWTGLLEE